MGWGVPVASPMIQVPVVRRSPQYISFVVPLPRKGFSIIFDTGTLSVEEFLKERLLCATLIREKVLNSGSMQ